MTQVAAAPAMPSTVHSCSGVSVIPRRTSPFRTLKPQKQMSQVRHLVGDVEEGQVVLLLHQVGDLRPLLLCGVDTRWVVRAACSAHAGRSGSCFAGSARMLSPAWMLRRALVVKHAAASETDGMRADLCVPCDPCAALYTAQPVAPQGASPQPTCTGPVSTLPQPSGCPSTARSTDCCWAGGGMRPDSCSTGVRVVQ